MSTRRNGVKALSAAGLLALLTACGGQSDAGPETIRLSSYQQQNTAQGQAIDAWADQAEECANGAFEFERFHGGSLFGATDTRDALEAGRIEVGAFSAGYHLGDFPLTDGLFSTSFMSTNVIAVMDAINQTYAENDETQAEWHNQNMHLMTLVVSGPVPLFTNVPVETLDDLSGLDFRGIPGGGINAGVEASGANPVDLELADLPEAMERGVIDGFSGAPIDVATSSSLHETVDFGTEAGFGVVGGTSLAVNKDWWDSLPAETQDCMTEAANNLTEPYVEILDEEEGEACDLLAGEDVQLSMLAEAETEELRSLVQEDQEALWAESAEGVVDDPQEYLSQFRSVLEEAEDNNDGLVFGVERCQA